MLKYFANQPSYKRRKVSNGPSFAFAGSNLAFQAALIEASYTGLALGFSGPTSPPQYWLRGARYPNFLGVPGATYTRTGNRAGLDAAVVYAANVPRVAPGSGLRVFGSGTNLVRASEGLSASPWSVARATMSADNQTAPNGSLTADTLTEDTTSNSHPVFQIITGIVTSTVYTASAFVRPLGRTQCRLSMGASLGASTPTFDLTGLGSVAGLGGATSATCVAVGAGWYRVTSTFTSVSTGSGDVYIEPALAGANFYLGTGIAAIAVWGAQLEQSSFATDYIPNPNTAASSSAGADDATIGTTAGVNLGADHAILVEGIVPDLIAGAFPDLIGWSASSTSVGIFTAPNGQIGVNAGGSSINAQGGPTLVKGNVVRALFRVSGGNTGRLFVNGVAATTSLAFTPSTGLASLFLGQTPAKTALLGSSLNIAAVLLRAPSDAECLAMTAP